MKLNLHFLCRILTLGFLSSPMFATSYIFVAISLPGALSTIPTSVNDLGQIVGTYADPSGTHGFLYSNGSFQTLHDGNADVLPIGIDNAGQYVARNASGYLLYSNGAFTSIDSLISSGPPTFPFASVAGINNNGQFLANYPTTFGDDFLAVSFNLSTFIALGGGGNSFATALNDNDAYVSVYGGFAGNQAYGPAGQIFTPANSPISITATGLNNSNDVVGYYFTQFTSTTSDNGFVDMGGISTTLDYPNAAVTKLAGINNLGEIVGSYGNDPNSSNTDLGLAAISVPVTAPVPEPGGNLLVFASLACLTVIGRRNKL